MDLQQFFNRVERTIAYLAGKEYSFDEYLRLSLMDRRVRNAFVYYALSSEQYRERLFILADRYVTVRRFLSQLYSGLQKVIESEYNRQESKEIAKHLLRYVEDNNKRIPTFNPQNKVYNESHEMAKFLETIVNNEMRTKHQTPEQRAYVERKMKNVDMDKLFVSQ